MANKDSRPPAPLDEATYLPLAVVFVGEGDDLRLVEPGAVMTEDHHGYFEREPLLLTAEGQVARALWLERLSSRMHWDFHRNHTQPNQLTPEQLIIAATYRLAGYIPGRAVGIDVQGKVHEADLSDAMRRKLAGESYERGLVRVENMGIIKPGLFNQVIRVGLPVKERARSRRWMNDPTTHDMPGRSRELIYKASQMAVESCSPHFATEYEAGHLPFATTPDIVQFLGGILTARAQGDSNTKILTRLQKALAETAA